MVPLLRRYGARKFPDLDRTPLAKVLRTDAQLEDRNRPDPWPLVTGRCPTLLVEWPSMKLIVYSIGTNTLKELLKANAHSCTALDVELVVLIPQIEIA